MDRLSDLSLKEEARLIDHYADDPLIRALLVIDLFIRRAARRLLATDLPDQST